jgi:hypothetical protein
VSVHDERDPAVERLVVDLGVALQNRGVYPSGHPSLRQAVARAVAAHRAVLAAAGGAEETTLLEVDGHLLVDRVPVSEDATWSRGLLLAFERHGISGLTLLAGLGDDELARFLDSCHAPEGPQPSRHLLIGRAAYAGEEAGAVRGFEARETLPPLARPEELAAGRDGFTGVAAGSAPEVDRLRQLVVGLARAAAGARLEPPRLPGTEPADREFIHGLATALGTMRLAGALGVAGDALHDLGLAGLLHDVGRLETGGGAGLAAHPVAGAARLAATPGVPAVAVAVAFEHHLRFDGEPAYPRLAEPRGPCAAARVVAVADTWDTLRTRGRLPPVEAAALLRRRAGSFLDPHLVEVFTALVGRDATGDPP